MRQPRSFPSTTLAGSAWIVPPCTSATRRASVSPRPKPAVPGRARLVAAVERLEDALALVAGDAGAVVVDAERDRSPSPRAAERDRRRAVLGGVLDQVPQRALEQRAVGQRSTGAAVAAAATARLARGRRVVRRRARPAARTAAPTSTAPRCVGSPVASRRDAVSTSSISRSSSPRSASTSRSRALVLGVARQELERDADARQRRAQLVRDVGQQLLLPAHQPLDALGHLVPGARQLARARRADGAGGDAAGAQQRARPASRDARQVAARRSRRAGLGEPLDRRARCAAPAAPWRRRR